MNEVERQMRILASGTDELLPRGGLEERLRRSLEEGRPLRVKFGVDPTRPDLHLGHAVPLRKLRQFQDLGHQVILLIGDFTARVGDPSSRDTTRPQLSREEVEENARTYTEQAFRILDPGSVTIEHNSRWLAPLTFEDLLSLTSHFTVARLLERDDFHKRYRDNIPICLHEFLYPVMQAYDSVALEADVEIGGTDQKFNLLAGRELQRALGQEPQCVMTLPILVGLDGTMKMSKSLGNHVGLTDPAEEMFGKLMSLPDRLMPDYLRLTAGLDPETVEAWLSEWETGKLHPAELKRRLAGAVVGLYWGEDAARLARKRFDLVFRERRLPRDIPVFRLRQDMLVEGRILLARLAALAGLYPSVSEARRSMRQGGLRLNGEKMEDEEAAFSPRELRGAVLQKGKRAFVRIEAD